MTDWLAIGLLIAALALFLLSTRQFNTWMRFAIWVAGAGALAASGLTGAQGDHGRMLGLLADMFNDRELRAALVSNWAVVANAIAPLLVLFAAVGVVMAVLALLALSRGEALERALRPAIGGLMGVVLGGMLALGAVALGFGGYFKPRAYVLTGAQIEVIDGDTFTAGDISFRIANIDAPEITQACLIGVEQTRCGADAKAALERLVGEANLIMCSRDDGSLILPEESFGRPLVRCHVRTGDATFDLGQAMIDAGWAVPYARVGAAPLAARFGGGCTLHPAHWRNDRAQRTQFESGTACPVAAGGD